MFSYALSETCIQSDRDVVKCNIIEAKNAFKLIETDQLYLYEPTVIADKTIGDVDYWYQLYHIDPSTNIIDNQKFELSDHYMMCFRYLFKSQTFINYGSTAYLT